MKRLKYTTAVLCVLSLILLVVPAMAAPAGTPAGTRAKGEGGKIDPVTYKPGEVIVIWKDGAPAVEKTRVKSSAGVERALTTAGSRVKADRELLKLTPGVSTEAAVSALRESPAVEAAGFNWLKKLSYTPPSPDFSKQWGLNNTGQTIVGQPGTPGADIDATDAWDIERGNSNATTVAVIDSGIDLNHPNLSGRLWTNSADPVNGVDDDGNGYIDDYYGYNWAGISNYGATDAFSFGEDNDSQFVAQKFRAQGVNSQCPVAGLEMFFYGKTGNPTQTITYAIRSSLAGANIAATNPILPSRIAASGASFVYEPFTSVANLTPGNNYFFVVYTSAADASNYYYIVDHVYDSEGYDSYVEGSEWWNFGGVWTEFPSDDFYFKGRGYYYNRDNNGHGTHCCGTVGAEDSGAGSVGVAPGNATRLMALKAGDSSGSLWSNDWMDAIDYASSMGVDIASMSFGGTGSDPAEQTVITNAYNNGLALFASSGNSWDSTMQYPVGYDNVIGVGATDNRDAHADFSTYNSSVDVSAPGVDYYSTMPTYPVSMNAWFFQNYDYMSGTSMACPCAAGTGALVRSKYPAYTPDQTQSRLQSTADDLGGTGLDDYFGWGRLNACRAVGGTATRTVNASVSGGHGTVSPATQVVSRRGTATLNVTPETGYHTASITDNGAAKTVANPYVISDVTADHNVVVTFQQSTSPPNPPTPTSPTWYLAEGSTDYGFATYITIENSNSSKVTCKVTCMTKTGAKKLSDVTLPAMSQAVVNPASTLGSTDFSTKVQARGGKGIAVDRRMLWTGPGAASQEGHSSVGVTAPANTWYLPEGSSDWNFECWTLVQNPNSKDANVELTYMIEDKGPVTVPHLVKANSRDSFSMEKDLGGKYDASIKVESDIPVIPERSMYRNNRREGHDSIGTTTPSKDYYLAEGSTDWGFTTYVLVQNPNSSAASVTLTYMTKSGVKTQNIPSMPPDSRKTVNVGKDVPGMANTDFSTRVHSDKPIIAERAMYWNGGPDSSEACHDSIGMSAPHTTFYLPDGEATSGCETYTLVQNPNSTSVKVEITYLTTNGRGNKIFTTTIAKNSRKTFNMADKGIKGRAAIIVTSKTPGKKIVVERSMYWNNKGAGTDTIGAYTE